MLRSLHQYIERSPHKYSVRLLANYCSVEKIRTPTGILIVDEHAILCINKDQRIFTVVHREKLRT
jgi:hypothetical protein